MTSAAAEAASRVSPTHTAGLAPLHPSPLHPAPLHPVTPHRTRLADAKLPPCSPPLTVDFDDVALTLGAPDADLDVGDLGGSALPAGDTDVYPELQLVLVLEGAWIGLEADGTLQSSRRKR